MFEEASNRITAWLSKIKIISSDQEVVCKWGITHILDTLFNIATFTAIGLLFRMLPETNEGLNIKLERWCIHMKKKICSFITRFGGTMAALALVVATMTANSTCLWLSHQPEEPEEVKMLKKD